MSVAVTIDWTELKLFNSKLREKMLRKWLDQALEAYALTLEKMIVNEIDDMDLNVSGNMKKSVTHKVTKKINAYLVEVGVYAVTEDGYPYPVGVHEGTIPHKAPFHAIETWARLKTGYEGEELAKVAWGTWNKIRKHGTEAHPFMTKVFEQNKDQIRAEIGKELLIAMGGGQIV